MSSAHNSDAEARYLLHRHDNGVSGRGAGAPQQRGQPPRRPARRSSAIPRPVRSGPRRRSARTAGRSPGRRTRPSIRRRRTRRPRVAEQRVRGRPVGTVPVTAGPTVPIVVMDSPSLRAVPASVGKPCCTSTTTAATRSTPSSSAVSPTPATPSWTTRAIVQTTAPSVRQGLAIYGPRTDVFVDRVSLPCNGTASPRETIKEETMAISTIKLLCTSAAGVLHWRARSRPGRCPSRSDRVSRDPDRPKSLGLPAVRCRLVARAHLHADGRRRLGQIRGWRQQHHDAEPRRGSSRRTSASARRR